MRNLSVLTLPVSKVATPQLNLVMGSTPALINGSTSSKKNVSMKAAVVHDFDVPPRYDDFPDPVAEAGEIVLRVRAAALSQLVKAQASGRHYSSGKSLPLVPGVDGVRILPDGRRVYFAIPRDIFGAMAEKSVVQTEYCVEIPVTVDDVTAAAIGNPGMSSWSALLDRAKFVSGETVLINGATVTSGRLAIQIGKYLGAKKLLSPDVIPSASVA